MAQCINQTGFVAVVVVVAFAFLDYKFFSKRNKKRVTRKIDVRNEATNGS